MKSKVTTILIASFILITGSNIRAVSSGGGKVTPMPEVSLPPPKPFVDTTIKIITAIDVSSRQITVFFCATGQARQFKLATFLPVVVNSAASTLENVKPGMKINANTDPNDLKTLVTITAEEIKPIPN